MNYLKIVELANECEITRQKINEHYRMLGANNFSDEVKAIFYAAIKQMEYELKSLETKLRNNVNK